MAESQLYSIVDIETTGGDPKSDRITEIAIFLHDGEKVIDEFISLVNPGRPIPDFITRLTGIDNQMVHDAPPFYEIARRVVEITQDSVFVAHNARFDYSFVQKEFRTLGYTYSRKQLCTVKLSRKLIKGLKSYSLGTICEHLKIDNQARHRAAGDASATVELLEHLFRVQNQDKLPELLKSQLDSIKIPPSLNRDVVEALPDEPGVYYFYDADGQILYVGKSNHIRKRVLSHFQGAYKSTRTIAMFEQIADVAHECTGSELIALLLENEEIKRLQPPFNRAQRRAHYRFGVYAYSDQNGYLRMSVGKFDEKMNPVAGYTKRTSAEAAVKRCVEEYELCLKLNGLQSGRAPCFYYHLHKCKGACLGEEPAESYNERMEEALESLGHIRRRQDSFLVISEGRHTEERSVVWVEHGIYRGFAWLDEDALSSDQETILSLIPHKTESPDVQRIIQAYIRRHPKEVRRLSLQSQNS